MAGRPTPLALLLAALLVIAVPGCSSDSSPGPVTPTTRTSEAAPSPPSAVVDTSGWSSLPGPLARCGPQPPRVAALRPTSATLRHPGARLPAFVAGTGRTVVVLLHQSDRNGRCGWLTFAQRIVARGGFTVLAPDLCGYGDAVCPTAFTARQVDQVELAVAHASGPMRARRVLLVGASMGGSLAVLASARDLRVDALVDLSGPATWADTELASVATRLRAPGLFAMAEDEGPEAVAAARALAAAAPPGSRFLVADQGHGFDLLEDPTGEVTTVGRAVLAWLNSHAGP